MAVMPAKMNPVVRPFMECLRKEHNPQLQVGILLCTISVHLKIAAYRTCLLGVYLICWSSAGVGTPTQHPK